MADTNPAEVVEVLFDIVKGTLKLGAELVKAIAAAASSDGD